MYDIPIFQTNDQLPPRLGELELLGVERYDDADLGVKIRYSQGMTKADVFLYNLGMADIPSSIHSEQVMEYYQKACNDVYRLAEMGHLLDLELRRSEFLELPTGTSEPMYLWAAFRYKQALRPCVSDDGYRFSHVFVRTDHGYIHKIRYTYLEREVEGASERMINFLLDWCAAIPRN